MAFGEKLRKLTKARGIKAITLAQRMGVSCAYVSQLITGIRRPGRETLLKLSKALEVPLETLLLMDADVSDRVLFSRKVPVLDEVKMQEWGGCADLDYPYLVAATFEYATTDDVNAFYITPRRLLSCCGLDSCDLILVEPNKEVSNGDTVMVCSPEGVSIRKYITKGDVIIFMDDKQEPFIFSKENRDSDIKYYRISLCLKRF
jgi:transcriptional regulator with XRE-family HTH domain